MAKPTAAKLATQLAIAGTTPTPTSPPTTTTTSTPTTTLSARAAAAASFNYQQATKIHATSATQLSDLEKQMAIKESPRLASKRARLTVNDENRQQAVMRSSFPLQEQARISSESDQWSELFDSFKDTNHLKELHCR